MATRELARAKVNLALHVTGQQADGYHLLDSIVVFAEIGDRITCVPAETQSLAIIGPEAAELDASPNNLVLRAARCLSTNRAAAITLEKILPVASGIGGGSADAAATLRALSTLWGMPLPDRSDVLTLGADVPVCLLGAAARMQGVGEVITPLAGPLPKAWLVLANPRVAVATPAVFKSLQRRDNAPLPKDLPRFGDVATLAGFLRTTRNDLAAPATAIAPTIGDVIAALSAQPGCDFARMSGSGATCFGLFASAQDAAAAAQRLQKSERGWWVTSAAMVS